MRVLEIETTQSGYNMGKNKKHKLRKAKEASESSDDGTVPTCNHVNMAVNVAAMKKGLAKHVYGECVSCSNDVSSGKKSDKPVDGTTEGASSVEITDIEPTLWVCLQCGHQGCDRNSREKHALKHYETPRSSCHCLVINTTSWSAWCYKCDDEVPVDRIRRLQECIELIRKQAGLPQTDLPQAAARRPTGGGIVSSATTDLTNKETKGRPLTPKGSAVGSCIKIKGLSNLGNTCFFNAVMQNLTQTHCLESLLVERDKKGRQIALAGKNVASDSDESSSGGEESDGEPPPLKTFSPIEILLGEAGPLTHSLLGFLQEMNNSASKSSTFNPSSLFGQVCKKAQRFRGFQQQDSHELLRYLLDNMRTEEIKRGQSAILKVLKLNENVNPKKVDEETKYKVKEYGKQVKHTFVDSLFGGHLISTVMCEECKYISQVFEPFLDLSLPVTEEKPLRPNQITSARRKESQSVESPEEPTPTGVDGFASKSDKPSKNEIKKMKRQAKKDAKLKKNKLSKNKVLPVGDNQAGEEDGAQEVDGMTAEQVEEEEGMEKKDKTKEESKEGEDEGDSSNRDDPSDADVEDNLESDTSRCNKYSALAFDPDSSLIHSVTMEMDVEQNDAEHSSSTATLSQDGNSASGSSCTLKQESDAGIQDIVDSSYVSDRIAENECNGHVDHIANRLVENDSNIDGNCIGSSLTENSCSIQTVQHPPNCNGEISSISSISSDSAYVGSSNGMNLNVLKNANIDDSRSGDYANGAGKSMKHCDINGQTKNINSVENKDISISEVRKNKTNDSICNGDVASYSDLKNVLNGDQKNISCQSVPKLSDSLENIEESLSTRLQNLVIRDENSATNGQTDLKISTSVSVSDDVIMSKTEDKNKEDPSDNFQPKSNSADIKRVSPTFSRQNSKQQSKSRKELKKEAQIKSTVTLGPRYHPTSRECTIMSCLHQFTSAELLTGNNKFGCRNCTKYKYRQTQNKDKKETVKSNASKQYFIYVPPAILTLHLKRFEQVGFSTRKVSRHVDFPFVLDLAPFCSSLCQGVKPGQKKILYSLYGLVEHSGHLHSGHYTAYVKVRPNIGMSLNFLNVGIANVKEYVQRYSECILNGSVNDAEETEEMEEKLVPPGRWYHISDSRVSEVTESAVQRAQAYLLFYERIY